MPYTHTAQVKLAGQTEFIQQWLLKVGLSLSLCALFVTGLPMLCKFSCSLLSHVSWLAILSTLFLCVLLKTYVHTSVSWSGHSGAETTVPAY